MILWKVLQKWLSSVVPRDQTELPCLRVNKRYESNHTSLKARLNRFNIVSTAKCECGDGLQTEEHIFWDCKRYEEQRAAVMDVPSENSKKEYPKSVTDLLRLEEETFLQGVCYFTKTFLYFFINRHVRKEKEVNVQNTKSILSDLC
jgi:hypothetical protein